MRSKRFRSGWSIDGDVILHITEETDLLVDCVQRVRWSERSSARKPIDTPHNGAKSRGDNVA